MKELLNSNEAAELLAVHPETLRQYAASGKINFQKTKGGHRRYSIIELEKFKANREKKEFHLPSYDSFVWRAEVVYFFEAENFFLDQEDISVPWMPWIKEEMLCGVADSLLTPLVLNQFVYGTKGLPTIDFYSTSPVSGAVSSFAYFFNQNEAKKWEKETRSSLENFLQRNIEAINQEQLNFSSADIYKVYNRTGKKPDAALA